MEDTELLLPVAAGLDGAHSQLGAFIQHCLSVFISVVVAQSGARNVDNLREYAPKFHASSLLCTWHEQPTFIRYLFVCLHAADYVVHCPQVYC